MTGTRTGDDVWAEIQHKCRLAQERGEPIRTLDRDIPNYIVEVGDTYVERESGAQRGPSGGPNRRVHKSSVTRIWHDLVTTGESTRPGNLVFAWALVARLINGIGVQRDPLRLYLADRNAAMTPFLSGDIDQNGLEQMSLAKVFRSVMDQLRNREKGQGYSPDDLDRLITREGPETLRAMLPEAGDIRGGLGIGTAAHVPWVGLFPPGSPGSAQTGCYLVYLFAKDGTKFYLSLNEGTENLRGGTQPLRKRALDIVSILGDRADADMRAAIDLRSDAVRPRRYEAGSAIARCYIYDSTFTDEQLERDLAQFWPLLEAVVSSGMPFDPEIEPIHMLFKWNADRRPTTISDHMAIAEREGSVWWGRFGTDPGKMSPAKLADLHAQLDLGKPTHVVLNRRGEVWQADLIEVTQDRDLVRGDPRLPDYYTADDCNLFVRINNFRQLEPDWAVTHWC